MCENLNLLSNYIFWLVAVLRGGLFLSKWVTSRGFNIWKKRPMANINGIPVFEATLDSDNCGIYRVSFVDFPAVESDFVALAKTKPQMYAIANEEKRLVRGVLVRADFPIYRCDPDMGEYYLVYKASTIREMAEKFIREGRVKNVNQMHIPLSDVSGVDCVQIFIKDTAAGIAPEGFDNISDGSLFIEYHVKNDEMWAMVKDGTYRGFSLEGLFTLHHEADELEFSKLLKSNNMTFKEKIAQLLAQEEAKDVQLRNITTDKGLIAWEGDEDLAVDTEVFVEDEEGNRTPAPEGDYTLEDGRVVRVADGKVVEIIEAAEEGMAEETPDIAALDARIAALEAAVKKLQESIGGVAEGAELMAEEIAKLKKEPAAKPAREKHREEEKLSPIDKLRAKLPNRK